MAVKKFPSFLLAYCETRSWPGGKQTSRMATSLIAPAAIWRLGMLSNGGEEAMLELWLSELIDNLNGHDVFPAEFVEQILQLGLAARLIETHSLKDLVAAISTAERPEKALLNFAGHGIPLPFLQMFLNPDPIFGSGIKSDIIQLIAKTIQLEMDLRSKLHRSDIERVIKYISAQLSHSKSYQQQYQDGIKAGDLFADLLAKIIWPFQRSIPLAKADSYSTACM